MIKFYYSLLLEMLLSSFRKFLCKEVYFSDMVYMFGGSTMCMGGDAGVFGFLSSNEIFKINVKDQNYDLVPVELLQKRSLHTVVQLDGTLCM